MHLSVPGFCAVLSTLAYLTAGQKCREGLHLTGGHCCRVGTTWRQSPSGAIGTCCRDGSVYHHNSAETQGTCCPPDDSFKYDAATNKCVQTTAVGSSEDPEAPEPPAKPATPETPSGQVPIHGTPIRPGGPPGHGGVIPPPPSGDCGCKTGVACPTNQHLGIQYGKCYNLIDTNGLPLCREANNGVYASGSDVCNLMFRVCKSTDDCSEDEGLHVPAHNGKFFLQDQQGWTGWQGPGWFSKIPVHFKIDYRAEWALQFKGEPLCMYGSSAICLRDGEKNRGLSAPCPLGVQAAMGHIGFTNVNSNSCKAYRFIEASCMKEMATKSP